jgi:hypothetical protein
MRHVPWLAACLLVVSCTVNSDNLNVQPGGTGTGGQTAGSGGAGPTGGSGGDDCPRCVPTGGTIGTGGQSATGGTIATGGQTAAGGQLGTGGQPATGGQLGTAGQLGTGGQLGTAGQPGTGGQIGAGGHPGTGGQVGAGGGSGHTCSQLENEYTDALATAKACTIGAGLQCRELADNSIACPGCRVYVNDTTELTALKAQWTSSGCALSHGVCPAIACVMPAPASCAWNVSSGPGGPTNMAGTCTSPQFGN